MNKSIFGRAFLLTAVFTCFLSPVHAQTVTPDSTARLTFSSSAGSATATTSLNLAIGNDTNVMGFKFDILFPRDTFIFDSASAAAGALLTTNASGNETYVFIVDQDSANAIPQGRVTMIGVRMQSTGSNKGLNNQTYVMLSGLRFLKLNTDTAFAGRDTIYVTNFVFRDANNETVATSRAQIELGLFLQLLRRDADFNGDSFEGTLDDLIQFRNYFRTGDPLGSLTDYGAFGDANRTFDQRTSDGLLTQDDLILFRTVFRGDPI